LNVVSQRVSGQTNSTGGTTTTNGTTTTTTPPVQVIDIPQPGGQLTRRVTANANNFTLLNQLPNSLNNNTNSVTAPIGSGNVTAPIGNITAPTDNTSTTTTVPTGGGGSTTGARPSVVNLSLGGSGHSNALDAAVQALVDQGVVMVIAAGNDGVDVGTASPADTAGAITVGAMDVHDAVPSFSNFGAKVDVFAPGVDVISCGITSNTASAVKSGTSMSTPHITGLSALFLGDDPSLTPAQVKARIQSLAIRGALGQGFQSGNGTQNLLAQNGL